VKRWQAYCLAVELVVWLGGSIALAEKIPSPEALEQFGARPVTLSVIEPHLSTPEQPVAVDYLAFPAPVVISAAVGPEWEAKTKMIEFRALDGYVSRSPVDLRIPLACPNRAQVLIVGSPAARRRLDVIYVLRMCGRIIQSSGPLRYAIVEGLDLRDSRLSNYQRRWNGAPSQELLVIRENHKTGERSLDLLVWGLIPQWRKPDRRP
jgi:hypothetical protein